MCDAASPTVLRAGADVVADALLDQPRLLLQGTRPAQHVLRPRGQVTGLTVVSLGDCQQIDLGALIARGMA